MAQNSSQKPIPAYLVFHIEMNALSKYVNKLKHVHDGKHNPHREFLRYMEMFVGSHSFGALWNLYKKPDTPITKEEKILYLHYSLGLNKRQIHLATKSSPNYILDIINKSSFKRQFQPDHNIDFMIEIWEPIRKLHPDEIFIKYC